MVNYTANGQNAVRDSMRFSDYVKDLPHKWILDNLISDDDTSRRIVSSAMVKDAVAMFTAKPSLAARFKALPPSAKLRCARAYLMGGNGFCPDEPILSDKDPLLTSLLAFAAQNSSGDFKFFGFDEFEPTIRPFLAETLANVASAEDCLPPAVVRPWRPLNDVVAVCSLAQHRQLKRSVHGGLSRSAISSLKHIVHDETLTGKSVTDGFPEHPSVFLIGFCLKESLLTDAESEYLLNRQNFVAWLKESMGERVQKMLDYAVNFLDGFSVELTYELLKQACGRWLSLNLLVPDSERFAVTRALNVLSFLGRVHIWRGNGASDVRFTHCKFEDIDIDERYAAEPKRDTLVMSDFSVIIPQEISPSELFDFSKIGRIIAFDKVYKGQITKESVSNALSIGITPEYLRSWLQERRAATNVVKTVDEWIREFLRLYVSRGSTLVSSDEKVSRQITSLEPLREYLVEVDAHKVFGIRAGCERKVREILEKLGFDTRIPGGGEISGRLTNENTEDADMEKVYEHSLPTLDVKTKTVPSSRARRWSPITDFSAIVETPAPPPMNRTKYGAGLKPLNISEIIHVVDYAILTNQAVIVDYAGSAYIKQSVYTAIPYSVNNGIDAVIDAEIPGIRGRKQFLLEKIKRIGVVAQ